jgi:chemotaxis protein methyltransferase WspC
MSTTERIAALLKQAMGLDIASVGNMLIERAIDERAGALGITDRDIYLLALQTRPEEMQELIELVVVPETWFFRDREAILAVARLAYEKISRFPEQTIRILSLPCSTGEEPYSIAMALLDAGVPPSRFKVDGIDICHRSLGIAKRAHYGRNSFRGKQLEYRDRHLTTEGAMSVVSDEVRRQVHFHHGNMFADDFLRHEAPYDFIFCRNVLIYFDRPMQRQAVQTLERLLAKNGTIFVGPAEAGIMLHPPFGSAGISLAFAFQRKVPQVKMSTSTLIKKPLVPLTEFIVPAPVPAPKKIKVVPVKPVQEMPHAQTLMERAVDYANQGELEMAASLCKQYQNLVGPSAAGFYLMGLINDARNDIPEALQFYRKAVYMQPDHVEALVQIAALLQVQGDAAGAQLMQQRAQRAKEQSHA